MASIKGLPRRILIDGDNRGGRYPTIARTGDRRMGNSNVHFNDTLTNVFTTGNQICFPTTLPSGSRYLTNALTTSMYITSSVRPASVENFVNFNPQGESFSPFREVGLYEQNQNTDFYATGSRLEDVGLGFSSKLGSKTQIRFELPIDMQTMMLAETASILYYNVDKKRFEQVGYTENPPGRDRRLANHPLFGTIGYTDLFADSKLFNAFGTNTISGSAISSSILFEHGIYNPDEYATSLESIPYLLQLRDDANATLNPAFAATSSQIIRMSNYINQPFLIEKAVIELPIKAGPGWSFDATSTFHGYAVYDVLSTFLTLDAGGPAVTVSLLNQINDKNRDVIMSGTIIPLEDDRAFAFLTDKGMLGDFFRASWGFRSFSTPCVTVSGTNGYFTGSVTMNMQAACSNGIITYNTYERPTSYPIDPEIDSTWNVGINPYGRNMSGYGSGRSYFGKEYGSDVKPFIDKRGNIKSLGPLPTEHSADLSVNSLEDNRVSPYLVFPTDNLILAVSKFRSFINFVEGSTAGGGGDLTTFDWATVILTASHDFGINTGLIRMTLYGSLIQEEHEFHDTLNEPLTSNAIHEAVGNDPVLDQFDVNYLEELSGTYTDDIVVGRMGGTSNYSLSTFENSQDRTVVGSNFYGVNPYFYQNARFGMQQFYPYNMMQNRSRICKFFDTKQYWDSYAPSITDIFNVDGAEGLLAVDGTYTFFSFDSSLPSYSSKNWTKSFPFADQYSSLKRNLSISRFEVSRHLYGFKINTTFNDKPIISFEMREITSPVNTTLAYIFSDTVVATNDPVGFRISDSYKLFYGFGDLNTMYTGSVYYAGKSFGTTNAPSYYTVTYTHVYGTLWVTIPIIRGWKYGMIQGFPLSPNAIFRRDHFGHPRDMLEQMLNSKMYDPIGISDDGEFNGIVGPLASPVQIRFVDNLGKQTQPYRTFSSNLSYEATSSLPYFDGEVRNREEPINTSFNNLTFVPIETTNDKARIWAG
jgi:hypothetical protein